MRADIAALCARCWRHFLRADIAALFCDDVMLAGLGNGFAKVDSATVLTTTMNTTAEYDDFAKRATNALLDDALKTVTATIERAAKSTHAEIANTLERNIRAHVTNYVTERLSERSSAESMPAVACNLPSNITLLPGEHVILGYDITSSFVNAVTNFGRYIYYGAQKHCVGRRLPYDAQKIMHAYGTDLMENERAFTAMLKAIDTFTSNGITAAKCAEIKAKERAKLDDERANLTAEYAERHAALNALEGKLLKQRDENVVSARLNEAQFDLNTRDRDELKRDIAASEAHKKCHAELISSHRQVNLIKAQLAKQAQALKDREAELGRERKRLTALGEELGARADALGIDLDDIILEDTTPKRPRPTARPTEYDESDESDESDE